MFQPTHAPRISAVSFEPGQQIKLLEDVLAIPDTNKFGPQNFPPGTLGTIRKRAEGQARMPVIASPNRRGSEVYSEREAVVVYLYSLRFIVSQPFEEEEKFDFPCVNHENLRDLDASGALQALSRSTRYKAQTVAYVLKDFVVEIRSTRVSIKAGTEVFIIGDGRSKGGRSLGDKKNVFYPFSRTKITMLQVTYNTDYVGTQCFETC